MSERSGAGAAPADRVQLSGALRDLCEEANQAHLATVLPDGSPHSVPVWIGIEGERVAFLTDPGSRKARNIARDPRVAISVTDREQPFTMAMIRGRVVDRIEGDGEHCQFATRNVITSGSVRASDDDCRSAASKAVARHGTSEQRRQYGVEKPARPRQ